MQLTLNVPNVALGKAYKVAILVNTTNFYMLYLLVHL